MIFGFFGKKFRKYEPKTGCREAFKEKKIEPFTSLTFLTWKSFVLNFWIEKAFMKTLTSKKKALTLWKFF